MHYMLLSMEEVHGFFSELNLRTNYLVPPRPSQDVFGSLYPLLQACLGCSATCVIAPAARGGRCASCFLSDVDLYFVVILIIVIDIGDFG